MLVVVHHGNVERALEPLLNGETLRRLDVFEVYSSERGSNLLYRLAELFGVFLVDLDVEDIHATIYLEQQPLSFHHRLAAHRTDVAQSEHSRSVRDDSHEVALVGVFIHVVGVLLYLQTGEGHSRRVGQRQVGLCVIGFGRFNFNLSRPSIGVIFQCGLLSYLHHSSLFLRKTYLFVQKYANLRTPQNKEKLFCKFAGCLQ